MGGWEGRHKINESIIWLVKKKGMSAERGEEGCTLKGSLNVFHCWVCSVLFSLTQKLFNTLKHMFWRTN